MFSAFSLRRASSRSLSPALKGFAVAATLFATALFAAPREASALFEDEAFHSSYESYVASWVAWQSDGDGVEGNYHYYATIYSYYGYVYAAYGDWYGNDYWFDAAIDYHDAASNLWDALVFYGVGFGDSYNASVKASAASKLCWWASFF
jgi:hypothetical protein